VAVEGGSRPSMANRADHENRQYGPSRAGSLSRRLTERDGVTLREEVRDWGNAEGDRPGTWRRAVEAWREYIRDKRTAQPVFESPEGDLIDGSDAHRFAPEYGDKQYAKLKDLERGLRDAYGDRLHTAMLTLTASSTDGDGRPRPPVDHLDGLLSSWDAVRRALSRQLDGRRWERLAILEPHDSGYIHVHMAVFVDGVVTRGTFAPVIEAHLRNCDGAAVDAHRLDDDDTISVRRVAAERGAEEIGNLGTYLAEYLGTYGDGPLEAAENVQMANALLWATGRQRWRPSNGAQEYMAAETAPPTPGWSFAGMRDAEGDVHEVPDGAGGVARFTTSSDRPPPD